MCPSADEWIKSVCVCVILLSHEKEWDNAICSNMDGPRDYQTKWSKPDRERWMSYDITYMWNLRRKKKDTNEFIYKIDA